MGMFGRSHALLGELPDRLIVLLKVRKVHAAEHVVGLGELNVRVADDLDEVSPGIAKIEKRTGRNPDPGGEDRGACGFLVLDDQAEVAAARGGGIFHLLERQELVAEVDEGHSGLAASEL